MAMLEVTNLCKRYEGFSLGPVNLRLEPGTRCGFWNRLVSNPC